MPQRAARIELANGKKIPAPPKERGKAIGWCREAVRERRVGIESLTRSRLFGVSWNVSLDARSNWPINPPASHYSTQGKVAPISQPYKVRALLLWQGNRGWRREGFRDGINGLERGSSWLRGRAIDRINNWQGSRPSVLLLTNAQI